MADVGLNTVIAVVALAVVDGNTATVVALAVAGQNTVTAVALAVAGQNTVTAVALAVAGQNAVALAVVVTAVALAVAGQNAVALAVVVTAVALAVAGQNTVTAVAGQNTVTAVALAVAGHNTVAAVALAVAGHNTVTAVAYAGKAKVIGAKERIHVALEVEKVPAKLLEYLLGPPLLTLSACACRGVIVVSCLFMCVCVTHDLRESIIYHPQNKHQCRANNNQKQTLSLKT